MNPWCKLGPEMTCSAITVQSMRCTTYYQVLSDKNSCFSINVSFPFSRRLHQLNLLKWIVDTLASGEQKRKGEATSITMKIRVIGCFVA